MLSHKMTLMTVSALVVLALNAWAGAGPVVLINLDVNDTGSTVENQTGAAAIGTVGDQWNYLSPPATSSSDTATNLIDSNGSATGVAFNFVDSPNGVGVFEHVAEVNNLLDDYIYIFGTQATLTFSNLKPNTPYDLYLYSTAGTSTFPGSFTFGSSIPVTGGWTGSYVAGTNYALFSGLNSGGSGTITGTLNTIGPFNFAVFNGFQLQGEIPEPASLSLLALTAGPLLLRRRR